MIRTSIFFSFLLILLSACTSNEVGNSKDVNPQAVYFEYRVYANAEKENVTILLQYRMGGPNGTTLVLNEPSKVQLDGEELAVDSANLTGAFYEIQKPLASFAGKHTITFTDLNGKQYDEEFEFMPFTLEPDILPVLSRGDLVFNFKGLKPEDELRSVFTDTSFSSDDINDLDSVRNGTLIISAERLKSLTNGPINLQFFKEVERPMKNPTEEGGLFTLTYGIQRNFELRD